YTVTVSGGDLAGLDDDVTLSIDDGGNNIEDAAGNALNLTPVPTTNNNTYTVDNTAPTLGTSTISAQTTTGFTITTQLDELGDVHYVVVADGAPTPPTPPTPPPTAAQIKARSYVVGGTEAVLASGTINIDAANTDKTGTVTGLPSPGTRYDVYLAGEDAADNLNTTTVSMLDASTADTDSDAQIVDGGETADIDYAANQQPDLIIGSSSTTEGGVSLAFIDITDAGSVDGIPTILTELTLTVTNDTYLRQLALYDAAPRSQSRGRRQFSRE
ncbi:MAG: hypothetical protein GDA37_07160, partial [Ekhidna sp.]|nr:hypothetical protein [Ekhidna sp.]